MPPPPPPAPGGGGGEDAEDLFSGEKKDGNLIGEIEEFPIKPSTEGKGVFGQRRKKKGQRSSNAAAEVPDFLVMTMDKRPQSTMNEPYGPSNMRRGLGEDVSLTRAMFGDSYSPKKTPEVTSVLSMLSRKIVSKENEKRKVLREDLNANSVGESDDE